MRSSKTQPDRAFWLTRRESAIPPLPAALVGRGNCVRAFKAVAIRGGRSCICCARSFPATVRAIRKVRIQGSEAQVCGQSPADEQRVAPLRAHAARLTSGAAAPFPGPCGNLTMPAGRPRRQRKRARLRLFRGRARPAIGSNSLAPMMAAHSDPT
jgi:hypothetical protein